MKRLLIFLTPLILIMLAFRPNKSFKVTGKVTDENGSILVGVSIMVKGNSINTGTAKDGTYQLILPSSNEILTFSFVGYQIKEVPVNGQSKIDVVLKATVNNLDEVVVIGYSSKKVKSITGSVSSMSYGLQGRAAGVVVTSSGSRFKANKQDQGYDDFEREGYDHITENGFLKAADNNGTITVLTPEDCIECGVCIDACPQKAISMDD